MDVPQSEMGEPSEQLGSPNIPSPPTGSMPTRVVSEVHSVWAMVLAVFWVAMTLSIVAVAVSSDLIGRPMWWVDDQRWPMAAIYSLAVVVIGPSIVVAVVALKRRPYVTLMSFGVAMELAILALVDRHQSPGSAVILGALAVAAALAALASIGARRAD